MEDCLDVVAVRIQDERPVIPRMVGTLAGGAIVATTGGDGCGVEGAYRFTIWRLKSQVHSRYRTVGLVHIELVCVEESGSFDQGVPEAECGHNGTIEPLAGVD